MGQLYDWSIDPIFELKRYFLDARKFVSSRDHQFQASMINASASNIM